MYVKNRKETKLTSSIEKKSLYFDNREGSVMVEVEKWLIAVWC